jgi:hypothetical protein
MNFDKVKNAVPYDITVLIGQSSDQNIDIRSQLKANNFISILIVLGM